MQKLSIEQAIAQIVRKDSRYHRDAYAFVREGLDFTIKNIRKGAVAKERHVTGQELLEGIRQHALQEFGPLAHTVLTYWNLRGCADIGEIVYNMVEFRILKTTERDSREDFNNGYDFEEAFVHPFEPARKPTRRTSSHPARVGSTKPS
ncbi:MAG: hypothetical protein HY360_13935 [Verrucomicrobia bacterium]|nr:hypothetical protein [Verrucomicrobiota bacterium]